MQDKDFKAGEDTSPVRILGRQLGRELDERELDAVSGGHGNYGTRVDGVANKDAYA